MAGYKIQLKDKNGNRQYPVSTTSVVVDASGVSVADLLDRKQDMLVSGQNIKTINGKSILGSGNIDIEGGGGGGTSDNVEAYPIYYDVDGNPLTDEQKAANKMAIEKYAEANDSSYGTPILYPFFENRNFPFNVSLFGTSDGGLSNAQLALSVTLAADEAGVMIAALDLTVDAGTGDVTINYADMSSLASHAYVDSKVGGGSGETAESDVICVVWDDDTSDIPSNKEAYQKLAESINTVGKPAAVMVCVETGYRWGIAKYYWKSNVGGDIELTTPVTESGLYCVFTLTSEGVCTASYKQVDLGGGGESTLENSLGVYVSDNLTAEQIEHNKNAYETYYNATDKPAVYIIGSSSQPIGVWRSSDSGVEFLVIDALVYFGSSEEGITYAQTMARWNADGTITEMQGGLRTVPTADGIKTINGQSLIGKGDLTIDGGGLKYFVERYVYEGKTEEERTYNLESLAMLEEGADILWAGMGGLQPNYEYGSLWGYMTTLDNYYGIFAKVDIDSETGALVMQTVEFMRDFYFAQGSEMKVLAANFFKIEGWLWGPAFYMGRPILYWQDGETDTMVNAYFLLDGLRTAYVSINIETGEVGSPVPVQSN